VQPDAVVISTLIDGDSRVPSATAEVIPSLGLEPECPHADLFGPWGWIRLLARPLSSDESNAVALHLREYDRLPEAADQSEVIWVHLNQTNCCWLERQVSAAAPTAARHPVRSLTPVAQLSDSEHPE
jgi:hypothetical protein